MVGNASGVSESEADIPRSSAGVEALARKAGAVERGVGESRPRLPYPIIEGAPGKKGTDQAQIGSKWPAGEERKSRGPVNMGQEIRRPSLPGVGHNRGNEYGPHDPTRRYAGR